MSEILDSGWNYSHLISAIQIKAVCHADSLARNPRAKQEEVHAGVLPNASDV